MDPGSRRPEKAQAEQGHQDAERGPEQAQRDPAVELLVVRQPAHHHHKAADRIAHREPQRAGDQPGQQQGQRQGYHQGQMPPGPVAEEHHHGANCGANQALTAEFEGVAVVAYGDAQHRQGGVERKGQAGEIGEAVHHRHSGSETQGVPQGRAGHPCEPESWARPALSSARLWSSCFNTWHCWPMASSRGWGATRRPASSIQS